MIRTKLLALPVAALFAASSAQAATYDITNVLDYSANGFGSSLFHDQSCGQMCGSSVADPLDATGSWDSVTGAISFLMNMSGGGTVTGSGTLNLSTTRGPSSIGYDGVFGSIDMKFAGVSGIADAIYSFVYRDVFHNPEANGTNWSQISLWGDLGNYDSGCPTGEYCMGGDFRFAISENTGSGAGGPAPVPLPGTLGLLVLGLGGLTGSRKLRKKG